MKKWMIKAVCVGLVAATGAGVAGCNRSADAGTSYADSNTSSGTVNGQTGTARYAKVVSVDPVRATDPQQVCRNEVITRTAPPRDQHRIAGTAIGAIVGGLVGTQVGGGRGRSLATVAGAVGGGYAGNRIEASRQRGRVTSTVERRCSNVQSVPKVVGYDVRYVYNGVTRTVRMDHDPGDRVQVQEGVIAVSDAR